MSDDLGLPWAVKSRQMQGLDTEKRLLKERGAKVHPRSGAGRIKEDGSNGETVYEVKDCRKTYTLKAKDLRASFVNAVRQGKDSTWLIYFDDVNFTAEVRLVPGGKEVTE